MHLIGRQDHILAGETTTWLKRTDARVSILIGGTVRLLRRHASKIYLRSKQESPRRKGSGPPQESYRRMSVNWGEGLDKEAGKPHY